MPIVLIARVDGTPYMLFGIDTFTSMCNSEDRRADDEHGQQRSRSNPSIANAKQTSVLVSSDCACQFSFMISSFF